MYRATPVTYLIEALSAVGLGRAEITCAAEELLSLTAPGNATCREYLAAHVATNGGRILNPEDRNMCSFCPLATTDDFLAVLNIEYAHRWRDLGFMVVYISFNVCVALGFYWLIRGRRSK